MKRLFGRRDGRENDTESAPASQSTENPAPGLTLVTSPAAAPTNPQTGAPAISVEPPTLLSPIVSSTLHPSRIDNTGSLSRPTSRSGPNPLSTSISRTTSRQVPTYPVIRKPVANRQTSSVRIRRTPSAQSIPTTSQNIIPLRQLPPANAPHPPDFGLPPHHEYDSASVGRAMSPTGFEGGRRRSTSEPRPPGSHVRDTSGQHGSASGAQDSSLARSSTVQPMQQLAEDSVLSKIDEPTLIHDAEGRAVVAVPSPEEDVPRPGMLTRVGNVARSWIPGIGSDGGSSRRGSLTDRPPGQFESGIPSEHLANYDDELVDLLDAIDPEVATLSTLTNVQNSLFIPNLGPLLNRRATYTLTRPRGLPPLPHTDNERPPSVAETVMDRIDEEPPSNRPALSHSDTLTSVMTKSRYAVLPHGVRLEGWTTEEKEELNDHVRHLLHSKKEAFKRSMRGFGQYVRRPLGFFVVVYATLITLFGAAWVLFLIGWISLGERRDYIINVVDNVLVALFAVMGDGLAPFRAVDTYHMIYIAHYHHLTWKLREKQALPELEDHNDLPARRPTEVFEADIEAIAGTKTPNSKSLPPTPAAIEPRSSSSSSTSSGYATARDGDGTGNVTQQDTTDSRGVKKEDIEESEKRKHEFTVLKEAQQKKLQHHQGKFMKSHTFYKPHETSTHFAFPLRLLVAIVVLLDCHSLLQISLGACTWSISYHVRPFALTTVILCCSITVNITAGILISIGDHRTRKKDVIERMFRQELTQQAIKKFEKKKEKKVHLDGQLSEAEEDVQAMLNLKDRKSIDLTREVGGSNSTDFAMQEVDDSEKPHDRWKIIGKHV